MWASLLVAAGLLAACGSSEAAEGDGVEAVVTSTTAERASTSTTVAETTTSRELTEEEVVVQTVAAAWDMLERVSAAPDPGDPQLAEFLGGPALERWKGVLADWQAKGYATRPSPADRAEHRPSVDSLAGDTAVVVDCSIDDGWLVDASTGELVDGDAVVRLWVVQLERTPHGRWQVIGMEPSETWFSGDPGCTADW